jgi:hypothetical protein
LTSGIREAFSSLRQPGKAVCTLAHGAYAAMSFMRPASQLRERHEASDFDTNTQDFTGNVERTKSGPRVFGCLCTLRHGTACQASGQYRVGSLGDLQAEFSELKVCRCIAITGAWTLNDDEI